MKADHLVKILAERGVASRRGSEKLVRSGDVTVDGFVVAEPGALVDPGTQTILIGGERLPARPKSTYLILHKPKAVITSRVDPEERRTVHQLLGDAHPSVESVGRLDYWTEGLLLMTNDGELAYRLTHPSYQVPKSYLVKITGTPQPRKLKELERGVDLEDGKTGPASVEIVRTVGPSSWLLVTLCEGRNRVVRRMMEDIGHRVLKLKRVGFGGIPLKNLGVGEIRELSRGEIDHLKRLVAKPTNKPRLTVPFQVREAVADALHLPKPERPQREDRVKHRDSEGRPFRKAGWARPKPKRGRPSPGGRKAGGRSGGRKTGGGKQSGGKQSGGNSKR